MCHHECVIDIDRFPFVVSCVRIRMIANKIISLFGKLERIQFEISLI